MGLDQTINGVLTRFKPRSVLIAYFVVQAIAIAAWWGLLVYVPDSRGWFFPESLAGAPLMSFWLADLGLLVGGSLLIAWLVAVRNPAASSAVWFLAGAYYYPALYCLAVSMAIGGGELGVAAMFVGGGLTLAMATVIGKADACSSGFRACSSSLAWAAIKTALQIAIFWLTFFIVLPDAIAMLQKEMGIAFFDFAGKFWLGLLGFMGFGVLGISSACWTLKVGRGTPLPTDCASVLVVTGPYRYVRNPMALAGIAQGVMVGVMWGSWPMMLYALTGGLVWHFGARPVEEVDLVRRFGEPYERYRQSVRCWVPRLSGFDASTLSENR